MGMIRGMTGFGSAEITTKKSKVIVELKSVNHRYFDISFYFPNGFSSAENKIRQRLQREIKRGRITVAIKVVRRAEHKVSINHELIKQYLKQAKELEKKYKITSNLSFSDVVGLPGTVETKEKAVDAESLWPTIESCLKRALNGLIFMRKREGKSLSFDVADKLSKMMGQIKQIQSRVKVVLKEKKKNVSDDEFTSYQKGSDINEETSRLSHYIEETKKLLKSTDAVGKKIDFFAQEMQRETNTIGSKQQDKIVSNAVITLKSKIEKIREQAQNIE